jgi:hypothetical protein
LAQKHTGIVAQRQEEGKALLTYFVGKGWLQIESASSGYDQLLESIWTLLTFWPARQLIWQGKLPDTQLFDQLWSLIRPHFTPAGETIYQQTSHLWLPSSEL